MTKEKKNTTAIDFSTYKTESMKSETPQGEKLSEEVKAIYQDVLNLLGNVLTVFTKLTNTKLSSGTILCNSSKQSDSDKFDFSYQINGNFEPLGKL